MEYLERKTACIYRLDPQFILVKKKKQLIEVFFSYIVSSLITNLQILYFISRNIILFNIYLHFCKCDFLVCFNLFREHNLNGSRFVTKRHVFTYLFSVATDVHIP